MDTHTIPACEIENDSSSDSDRMMGSGVDPFVLHRAARRMNSAPDRWSTLVAYLSDPVVQSVLGVVLLLMVSSIAMFALSKLRDSNTDNQPAEELLRKNFEEMRSEGDIDDQEFRKIKALLADGKYSPPKSTTPSPPRSTST
jgi:hypothetical protein